jgi:hypothetical protein
MSYESVVGLRASRSIPGTSGDVYIEEALRNGWTRHKYKPHTGGRTEGR